MSDPVRLCPACGHSLLGLTSSDEIASCPNCGKFFERYTPGTVSRWPSLWRMGTALCGPMVLVALMKGVQWIAQREGQQALWRVMAEAYPICLPLAWFGWPIVCAYLLATKYAAGPDRWMSSVGVAIAAMVANTAVMLASLLVQLLV